MKMNQWEEDEQIVYLNYHPGTVSSACQKYVTFLMCLLSIASSLFGKPNLNLICHMFAP